MKTIDEIRRENLQTLEKELGSTLAVANRLDMSRSQFTNLRDGAKDSKTGNPRGMRPSTARKIEQNAGKPPGWLDQDHTVKAPKSDTKFIVSEDVYAYDRNEFTPVPYYDVRFSNGKGVGISSEEQLQTLVFRTDFLKTIGLSRATAAAVQSTGDSNVPDIPAHDGVVLCKLIKDGAVLNGKYHAFRLGNDLYIKRLWPQKSGELIATSTNGNYAPIVITKANRHEFDLIGQVKWFCAAID